MKILFVPSTEKGNGTGHLKRCVKYVLESEQDSFLYLPEEKKDKNSSFESFEEILKPVRDKKLVCSSIDRKYDVIITDKRKTSTDEFEIFKVMSNLLVGLDEGGEKRESYPYLIDSLPSLSDHKPNLFSTGLLGIKDKRNIAEAKNETESFQLADVKKDYSSTGINGKRSTEKQIKNILVTFGGEDPCNLTEIILSLFSEEVFYKDYSVKAVEGPLFGRSLQNYKQFEIIHSPVSLEKYIDESDLVITSFGITSYEALYAGKYLLLVNPSDYHSELSKKAGIPEIRIKNNDKDLLRKYIENPYLIKEKTVASPDPGMDINKALSGLKRSGIAKCPFCGRINIPCSRFYDRNYYRCSKSSVIYMERFTDDNTDYGKDYFFDDYKKQYGKTYLDDFRNIKIMSDSRVKIIKKYKKSGMLLDVGCAYGPFLKASSEAGFDSSGMDISGDAVNYVNNTLGIDAVKCDFSRPGEIPETVYDAVTMWYVIEHFRNPEEVIEKVKSVLKPGGIFAFSTPDFSGISGRINPEKTLNNSPADHYTFWSKKSASEILEKNGFKILEIRSTGHHPERFGSKIKKIIPAAVLKYISFLLKLGDTFEIYAERK